MEVRQFIIDPKLKALIPPLTTDERKQLEANILADGIRDALVLAEYPNEDTGEVITVLADGHNRYEIAEAHGLDYRTEAKQFDSYAEVRVWMRRLQLGRRNLTDGWKWELAQGLREDLQRKGREKYEQSRVFTGNQHTGSLSINDNEPKHNTRAEIANTLGWSKGKTAQAEQVWKKAPEPIKEQVKAGDLTIGAAYKKVKKREELEQVKQIKEQQLKSSLVDRPLVYHQNVTAFLDTIPDQSIDLVVTDPPYLTEYKTPEAFKAFLGRWLHKLLDKLKPSGRAFICAGAYPEEMAAYLDNFIGAKSYRMDGKGAHSWNLDAPLIWTYRNTLGQTPTMKYNLNYQVIWHLYTNNSAPLDKSVTAEMFSVQDIPAPDGRQGNRYHTWQKPDELANRIIRHASRQGDTVLDCFACTGTFLLAAAKAGRKAIGCDIDKDNLYIAQQRGCKVKIPTK